MKNLRSLTLATLTLAALASSASADLLTYTIPAGGIVTDGEIDDPANFATSIDLGAGAIVTGIGYDVTLVANAPSYLSEAAFLVEDTERTTTFFVNPGAGDDVPGGPTAYSSGGILGFTDFGFDAIPLPDGLLNLQFYEFFDDVKVVDGRFVGGSTITIEYTPSVVPEPATLAALGCGAGALLRRRKRA